jgi:hypothetical protein
MNFDAPRGQGLAAQELEVLALAHVHDQTDDLEPLELEPLHDNARVEAARIGENHFFARRRRASVKSDILRKETAPPLKRAKRVTWGPPRGRWQGRVEGRGRKVSMMNDE